MKKAISYLSSLSLLLPAVTAAGTSADRAEILECIERIADRQKAVDEELEKLKALLGVSSLIDKLSLLEPADSMAERIKVRLEDGLKAYESKNYEQAKAAFQAAWEEDPNNYIVNFNLGMAYQRLGNTPLAKRMFKAALEAKPKMEQADTLRAYLEGKTSTELVKAESQEDDDTRFVRNELTNLKKEAESYLGSQGLSLPKKRASVAKVLKEMLSKVEEREELIKDYFVDIGEKFAQIELFDDATKAFEHYETAMEGEVLPDGYHGKVLAIEARQQELNRTLSAYVGNLPPQDIRRHIKRDQEELVIFGTQINEFVKNLEPTDEDFRKICQRLGEFRWGSRAGRHVIVVNRFEELLYSSLDGMLDIDRYQDTDGQKFLQNIVRLAGKMEVKDAEYVEVELWVNNEPVTYSVIYTYIPKHESFIIVRYPKRELS